MNRLLDLIEKTSGFKLQDGEIKICSIGSNLLRGKEYVGGTLILTNSRLVFIPHRLNIQTQKTFIQWSDIVKLKKDCILVFDTTIKVLMHNGEEFKFVLGNKREEFIKALTKLDNSISVE